MTYTREEWAALTPEERGPCEETTTCRDAKGYGLCGVKRFGQRINRTHRLAWIDANGQLPPPEAPQVLHHCDNPPCRRVSPLFLGTNAENVADKMAKGRYVFGGNGFKDWVRCKNGHEFTEENTILRPEGGRKCRECGRAAVRRNYWAKKRTAA